LQGLSGVHQTSRPMAAVSISFKEISLPPDPFWVRGEARLPWSRLLNKGLPRWEMNPWPI
ncbi:MAG: hypothetical protein ACWGSQ_12305, partial [Longimicrobiales bacterium]